MKQCKGKGCQNVILDGDKHLYCKSCRSKRAKKVKDGLVGAGKAALVVGGAAVTAVTQNERIRKAAEVTADAVKKIAQRR